MEAVLDEPYILLTDKKIGLVQDLVPVLEQIARTGACRSLPRISRRKPSPPWWSTVCVAC